MAEKKVGITTKKKSVKPLISKPYAPENKLLTKAQYVEKNVKLAARKAKLTAYNKKLIADEKQAEKEETEAIVKKVKKEDKK